MELMKDVLLVPFRMVLLFTFPCETMLQAIPPIAWALMLAVVGVAGGWYAAVTNANFPISMLFLAAAIAGILPAIAWTCRRIVGWEG